MNDPAFYKQLLAKELGVDLYQIEKGFAALCARLGIPAGLPEGLKWFSVTVALVTKELEVKRRARPQLRGGKGTGVDRARALAVETLRQEKKATGQKRRFTDLTLIEELRDRRQEFFVSGKTELDLSTLAQSVSRGKTRLKESRAEFERQKQAHKIRMADEEAKQKAAQKKHDALMKRRSETARRRAIAKAEPGSLTALLLAKGPPPTSAKEPK